MFDFSSPTFPPGEWDEGRTLNLLKRKELS